MEKIKDDAELYNLIYNRKYNDVFYSLKLEKENEKLSRSKSTILKLLYLYYQVCDNGYKKVDINYGSNFRNHFQRFFDSVNKKDLDEINFQISEIFRLKDISIELDTYKLLIDDINFQREFISNNPDFNNNILSSRKEVESLLRKDGYLNIGTITKIRRILNNIIYECNSANREAIFEKVYLEILDLLEYSLYNPISLDYFNEINKTNNKVADLLSSLELGDYKTTYDLLINDSNLDFNGINKTKLNILKRLLIKLNNSRYNAKRHKDVFKYYVNTDNYNDAFNYYLNNNFYLSEENLGNLLVCMNENNNKTLNKNLK